MSLFSAIQGSANALRVNQLGLQVVGNNIANVNTPGYVRQDLVVAPALGYRAGDLIIGQGVQAVAVEQKLDNFVLERLRQTQSQLSYQEVLESANGELESFLNELTGNDISTRMSNLSSAFQEVANQPGSESIRALAIQRGQELASQLRSVSDSVTKASLRNRDEVGQAVQQINRLVDSIAKLNLRIVEMEGGSMSDAVGLRDERLKAMDELSNYVDITTQEQPNGAVTVFVGGDYLVTDAIPRKVKAELVDDGEFSNLELRFEDTDARVNVSGGKIRGLYEAAQMATSQGFLGKLDSLTRDIIHVVNRIHSQGQGSQGFRSLQSEVIVNKTDVPLEVSNPDFNIENGSFTITLTDRRTSSSTTYEIPVRQQGMTTDTTPEQLAAAIDSIVGLSASVTNNGRFEIRSESEALTFSFSNDTSGALASLGINTFFTGDTASTIQVRSEITQDPTKLAISTSGVGNGAANAIRLAEAFNSPSSLLGGRSLNGIYDAIISDTTREINTQKGIADGLRNFQQTLESKHLGISGVNLDEEAVKMMLFQRAFQAQSRLVSVASDLLETLVNII
ncbi:Flagellar hook-associated protein 1 [Pirellula sp. SH-Sr6A]|uniref:flagellar hook-associated protein FlgK n=1 Tax=Pirellula sp. SH-Sr6A TaxID=1632865 RepID=UPI00078D5816|nr:flagellar hook-associated protein FlgK [Pirellula sp. SH-Sr6A]AMV30989.1 Flagellar hook-associated protein 1 [Pirellula sp. SH-Sr6A]